MKRNFILLTLLMLGPTFYSCSDDDNNKEQIHPLTFVKNSYEIKVETPTFIPIRTGNKDYTVTVDDKSLLDVEIILNNDYTTAGELKITPKKKGETVIEVIDNISSEKGRLNIKVTDNYLTGQLTYSTHPLFTDNQFLYLVKNEQKDFHLFTRKQNGYEFTPDEKGQYEFTVENDTPFLLFTYADADNERITSKFSIADSDNYALAMLNWFFGLGWESPQAERRDMPVHYYLKLKEEGTERTVQLTINTFVEIPEGMLD